MFYDLVYQDEAGVQGRLAAGTYQFLGSHTRTDPRREMVWMVWQELLVEVGGSFLLFRRRCEPGDPPLWFPWDPPRRLQPLEAMGWLGAVGGPIPSNLRAAALPHDPGRPGLSFDWPFGSRRCCVEFRGEDLFVRGEPQPPLPGCAWRVMRLLAEVWASGQSLTREEIASRVAQPNRAAPDISAVLRDDLETQSWWQDAVEITGRGVRGHPYRYRLRAW
jgi:hypothetical protein